jgi:hypothetical protein
LVSRLDLRIRLKEEKEGKVILIHSLGVRVKEEERRRELGEEEEHGCTIVEEA